MCRVRHRFAQSFAMLRGLSGWFTAEMALLSSERKLALCNILRANICETTLSLLELETILKLLEHLRLRCVNTHTIELSPSCCCLQMSGRVVSAVLPAGRPPSSVRRPRPVCQKHLWLLQPPPDVGVCSSRLR